MSFIKKIKDKYFYLFIWRLEMKREVKNYRNHTELIYLKKWYKRHTGLELNLENPQTFTDKQNLLKMNADKPDITSCTDKYLMRSFVNKLFGDKVKTVPVIVNNGKSFFTDPYEIVFEQLPEKFVIQCNHGAHMTHIVKSKRELGLKGFNKLQKQLYEELQINYAFVHGYELNYKDIKPGVFITEFLDLPDLPDYKFFYSKGILQFMWIDTDRHTRHKRTLFDSDFNRMEFTYGKNPISNIKVDRNLLKKMKGVSDIIASNFEHVRVDMYFYNDEIYIGELTFTSGAGIELPSPIEANIEMAKYLDVSDIKGKNYEKK